MTPTDRAERLACALAAVAVMCVLPAAAAAVPACPTETCDPGLLGRRVMAAARVAGAAPAIDGRLDEPVWRRAPAVSRFVQSSPRPGAPASLPSEARVLVDEQAIYIGLRYADPDGRVIRAPLARRDDETTSDWAFVEIDSRHDRRTGFSFGVNPRGVQVDGLWMGDTDYDTSWNGVWESAARRDERGWTAEFRIPFSQLAFNLPAGAASLTWGINFYRYSPAHRESSNWSPRYRGLRGIVSNFNDIVVPAPSRVVRFEVTPYVAPRWGDDPDGRRLSLRAGADLRVGLGSSVNLTATALPDFGQVEADPSQVNLSAFELFQPERRPFFLEGLDLFRMGTGLVFTSRDLSFADEAPFYSRRVGRPPRGEAAPGAVLESVPGETTLLGAGKLTGQTGSGWTLGMFSAVTDREDAAVRLEDGREVRAPVEARAATTVARATRSLGGGDSSLGLLAADLHRFGLSGPLAGEVVGDAAALGGEVQHRLGDRRYEVRGWLLGSRLTGDPAAIARVAESPTHYLQRPGGPGGGAPYGDSLSGIAGETRLSRVDGAFTWDLVGRAVSPGFDMNEIGFQRASDWLLAAGAWKLEWFRPDSAIRAWTVGSSNLGAGWTWDGQARTRVADAYVSADTRTSWTIKLAARHEATTLSTDRLRGGPAVLLPPRSGASISLVTDQNRASFASLDASAEREPGSRSWSVAASPSATVRIADPAWVSISPSYRVDAVGWQLLTSAGQGDDLDWIVGRVRQRTLAVALRADLVFTPRLVLQAYVQPFATVGRFDGFQRLVDGRAGAAGRRFEPLRRAQVARDPEAATLGFDLDGDGAIDAALPDPDGEERAFNASLVVRWEYMPGSTITAAATQERGGAASGPGRAPLGALGRLADDAPRDVLLLKLSWRLGT